MPKWLMPMILMLAIGCARTTARAQEEPTPPAPPAQPEAPQAQEAQAREERLKALADRERARAEAAALRAQVAAQADEARGQVRAALQARMKKERAAWLGVSTDKLPPALRQQLKLQHKGIGLIVERVEPKSPAEAAGLEQYDIIEKLGDQWLVNSEQFGVLIRMNKPGDEITLSIIRGGQPQQVKATLVEKELPVLGMGIGGGVDWIGQVPAGGVFNLAPEGKMEFFMDEAPFQPLFQLERLNDKMSANYVISDGEHTLRITTKNAKRHLEASDANGVVIFDGPIDTEEQRAALPDEIVKKLEKFDDMPGVIKLRRVAPATAPSDDEDKD